MDTNKIYNLKNIVSPVLFCKWLHIIQFVGHMQIAQIPDRHEPDSEGEVNYSYIFSLLEKLGYEGYIGLEYTPQGEF